MHASRAARFTDEAGAGRAVMELYSGAGLFSVPLARAVGESGRVVTLEGDEGAVRDAGENPPRAGAGAEVCEAIAATGTPRVVLVSCDPAAGARDLRTLTEAGYELESLQAWDLFPHTHHVETISVLSR